MVDVAVRIFRGFQRYIDPRKLQEEKEPKKTRYLPENTSDAGKKNAENKKI
jgi:hypothetical protein